MDGLVAGPPGDVREAPTARVARILVLELAVDTRATFVFTAAIPGAGDDFEAGQPESVQLFIQDPVAISQSGTGVISP